MRANAASMGGTTLAMMMPSTLPVSRPERWNRLRRSTPHSSAVCSWTVRRRQCATSLLYSKTPTVMLVLPASSASSTHTSRKNDFVGAVVFADNQEAGGVESGGGALEDCLALPDYHALASRIGGAAGEQLENWIGSAVG